MTSTPANEELLKACREFAEELARDTQTQVSSTAWVYPEMAKPAIEKIAQRLAAFVAERERLAQYEVAIFVDMCAAQCAEKARTICEPNYWWPKNQILTRVAEKIRERATGELSAQEGGK